MSASVEELGAGNAIVRPAADASALGMAFVLETRPDGAKRFVFAGPRCEFVNGVSSEAAMADANLILERILPEHRAAFEAAEAEARANMTPFDIEVAMRGADDEVCWRRFASLPRPQPDGSMLWDGLQIDVTDRRTMAAELVEQQRRLEVAIEAAGLGFWEWDVLAGHVTWSEHNKALYGLPPDAEVTVASYLEMVHSEDREGVRQAFLNAAKEKDGGDYSIEHRIITPDGEQRWILAHARVANEAPGQARLVVGTSLDITARKAAEERRTLLMGELAHRAKNGIAVLMALVSQSARGQDTVEGFQDLIMSRLQAMANSQDLVTASGGRPVALSDVIGQAVSPFDQARVDLDPAIGAVTIRGEMAVGMGLLLHEMATNALKYGALSKATGRVSIELEPIDEDRAAFTWRETGGPPVRLSNTAGFGTRLLQQVLRPQGGEVTFAFDLEGFRARAEFPTVR